MKVALLALVRIYWSLWPNRWKRQCLFRESCSRAVYRVTSTKGFRAGMSMLVRRIETCRSNFEVRAIDGTLRVCLCTGEIVPESEVNPAILQPYSRIGNAFQYGLEQPTDLYRVPPSPKAKKNTDLPNITLRRVRSQQR